MKTASFPNIPTVQKFRLLDYVIRLGKYLFSIKFNSGK